MKPTKKNWIKKPGASDKKDAPKAAPPAFGGRAKLYAPKSK